MIGSCSSFGSRLLALAVALAAALTAVGQEDEPRRPPSLDELLGLDEEDKDKRSGEVAGQEAAEELQRRLDDEQLRHAFTVALEKMTLSAELLETQLDPGLGTQRVQQEILVNLDRLIDEARKQCAGGGASSAQPSTGPQERQEPGKRAGDDPGRVTGGRPGAGGGGEVPEQGEIGAVLEEMRSEWGSLPQRVRDMLLQGRNEKFSSLYEKLTGEYYRRLAEGDSP
jgi:hypothetical protein